ncbi:STAS/SEC14 domain-containing protein [Paenarthrobacter sp. DKR-5]|uniref:DUF7793 family protein n=1 Tax=Paenarthrobacter sp. DKR-5 TaxID=2835535 RepID=UPI001BDCB057|nr:STAS/SEC14 domain-containing protein [Paenarthrobacter sp. DKR-5]MBT1004198.1 STAS/SEC14 domain-containing protein [Paenarthrobacter sp. DKR-5]
MTICAGKSTLEVRDAIIHQRWTPGSEVDARDAEESVRAVRALGGDTPRPLLLEMSDVSMSAAARNVYEHAQSVCAVALVGATLVDRVVAATMRRHDFCPHEFFTSAQDALAWLRQFDGQQFDGGRGH